MLPTYSLMGQIRGGREENDYKVLLINMCHLFTHSTSKSIHQESCLGGRIGFSLQMGSPEYSLDSQLVMHIHFSDFRHTPQEVAGGRNCV